MPQKNWFSSSSFNCSKKTLLLIMVVVAILSIGLSSVISIALKDFHNLTVPSLGTIKVVGVEVYWDSKLENKTEYINWGVIRPGSSISFTLYIKSVSNIQTTLEFFVAQWNPPTLSNYVDLSWDYKGTAVNFGDVVPVKLLMTLSSDDSFVPYLITNHVTTFDLEIHFVASELLHSS